MVRSRKAAGITVGLLAMTLAWLAWQWLGRRQVRDGLAWATRRMDREAIRSGARPAGAAFDLVAAAAGVAYFLGACEAELGHPDAALAAWAECAAGLAAGRRGGASLEAGSSCMHGDGCARPRPAYRAAMHGAGVRGRRGPLGARRAAALGRPARRARRVARRDRTRRHPRDRIAALRERWRLDSVVVAAEEVQPVLDQADRTAADDDRAWLARAYLRHAVRPARRSARLARPLPDPTSRRSRSSARPPRNGRSRPGSRRSARRRWPDSRPRTLTPPSDARSSPGSPPVATTLAAERSAPRTTDRDRARQHASARSPGRAGAPRPAIGRSCRRRSAAARRIPSRQGALPPASDRGSRPDPAGRAARARPAGRAAGPMVRGAGLADAGPGAQLRRPGRSRRTRSAGPATHRRPANSARPLLLDARERLRRHRPPTRRSRDRAGSPTRSRSDRVP